MICVDLLFSGAYLGGLGGIPMRKLICDKCKKEIDTSYMDKYDMHPSAMCKIFGDQNGFDMSSSDDLEYELCEDCTNKLVEFLKG